MLPSQIIYKIIHFKWEKVTLRNDLSKDCQSVFFLSSKTGVWIPTTASLGVYHGKMWHQWCSFVRSLSWPTPTPRLSGILTQSFRLTDWVVPSSLIESKERERQMNKEVVFTASWYSKSVLNLQNLLYSFAQILLLKIN